MGIAYHQDMTSLRRPANLVLVTVTALGERGQVAFKGKKRMASLVWRFLRSVKFLPLK